MIIDNVKNCELYYNVNENFKIAFEFINKYNQNPLETGEYDILERDVYAIIMEADLNDNGRFETHKEYIDIQYIVFDKEIMEVENFENLEIDEDLTPAKDVVFYKDYKNAKSIKFFPQEFVIFFPNDAHKPCLKADGNSRVKKIVVKVRIK